MATPSLTVLLLLAVTATAIARSPPRYQCPVFQSKLTNSFAWHPHTLPSSNFILYFRVAAVSDVMVVLSECDEDDCDAIIVTIGGDGNSRSSIERLYGSDRTTVDTPNELKCGQFNSYWIQIDPNSVKVGRDNDGSAFLELQLYYGDPIDTAYLGYGTGGDSVGLFTFDSVENLQVDPCRGNPCNFGTCVPCVDDSFYCDCKPGYFGQYCDQKPAPRENYGVCPKPPPGMAGACTNKCDGDSDCSQWEKCCSNGCGRVCVDNCNPVLCRLGCQNGFARDGRGCEECRCASNGPDVQEPAPKEGEEQEETFEWTTDTGELVLTNQIDFDHAQEFEVEKEEPSDFLFHSGSGQLIKVEIKKTSACILSSVGVKLESVRLPKWTWKLRSLRLIVRFVTDGFNVFVRSGSDDTPLMQYRKPNKGKFRCGSIGFRSRGKRQCKLIYRHRRFLGFGWLGDLVHGVGKAVGHVVHGVGKAVGHVVGGVGKAVGHVVHGVGHAVGHVVGGVGKAVGHVVGGVGHAVGHVVGGVAKAVGHVAHGVGKAVGHVANAIGSFFGFGRK